MNIAVIDCGTNRIPEIQKILGDLGHASHVLCMRKEVLREFSTEDFTKYDALIISGGPVILDQENKEEYISNFAFLKSIEIPVLGICFGHQIIGHVFGCDFEVRDTFKGDNNIHVLKVGHLFQGLKEREVFYENHSEHISVPDSFIHAASSINCHNESMFHKSKQIFGVQFHPEISGKVGEVLLENFINTI